MVISIVNSRNGRVEECLHKLLVLAFILLLG